jgi:hypothetical protein
MTDLNKKVSRRVTLFLDNRITVRDKDKITVTLHPDGSIGFRAHKCRREYRLPLSVAYRMAIQAEAIEDQKVKDQDRRLRGLKPVRRNRPKSWLSLRTS